MSRTMLNKLKLFPLFDKLELFPFARYTSYFPFKNKLRLFPLLNKLELFPLHALLTRTHLIYLIFVAAVPSSGQERKRSPPERHRLAADPPRQHNVDNHLYQKNEMFSCAQCDKMYSRARDLEIHKSYCTGS